MNDVIPLLVFVGHRGGGGFYCAGVFPCLSEVALSFFTTGAFSMQGVNHRVEEDAVNTLQG